MNPKQQFELTERLKALPGNEVLRLRKQAHQMRKTMLECRPKVRALELDDFEEGEETEIIWGHRKRGGPTVEDILYNLVFSDESGVSEPEAKPVGTVLAVHRGKCDVWHEGAALEASLPPEIAARQQTLLAVGDEVTLRQREEHWMVVDILPRRTKLSRPDPHLRERERVVVANVDLVVVVASVVSPPLRPGLLDRYWIAIQHGGAQMAVMVNKIDLLQDPNELKLLQPLADLGVTILHGSAHEGRSMDELRQLLSGKLSAFVGHSGVGKSSLLNKLKPDLGLEVGGVSQGYGRGTHTTTSSTMWQLDPTTRVIDTPGVRSFGLFKIKREELVWYFPEFQGFRCRFRDCKHLDEPGCAIREAAVSGDIAPRRYGAYRRFLLD